MLVQHGGRFLQNRHRFLEPARLDEQRALNEGRIGIAGSARLHRVRMFERRIRIVPRERHARGDLVRRGDGARAVSLRQGDRQIRLNASLVGMPGADERRRQRPRHFRSVGLQCGRRAERRDRLLRPPHPGREHTDLDSAPQQASGARARCPEARESQRAVGAGPPAARPCSGRARSLLLRPIDQALVAGPSDARDSGKISGETRADRDRRLSPAAGGSIGCVDMSLSSVARSGSMSSRPMLSWSVVADVVSRRFGDRTVGTEHRRAGTLEAHELFCRSADVARIVDGERVQRGTRRTGSDPRATPSRSAAARCDHPRR